MNCHIWVTDICHVKTCKDSDNTRGAQVPSSVYLERVNLQRYEIDSNAFLTKAFFSHVLFPQYIPERYNAFPNTN